jgi:hypothetical protein
LQIEGDYVDEKLNGKSMEVHGSPWTPISPGWKFRKFMDTHGRKLISLWTPMVEVHGHPWHE